MVHLYIVK